MEFKLDPITGVITNSKELTETQNTTKSQVQPFVTREASIPDLDVISKTYAKLREVTITYSISLQNCWVNRISSKRQLFLWSEEI